MAAPRIWPSTAVTVSASAISRITWLIPTPHRLTVYASAAPLPDAPATLVIGRLARPYPNGTFPRRIALTSPSARRLRAEISRAVNSTHTTRVRSYCGRTALSGWCSFEFGFSSCRMSSSVPPRKPLKPAGRSEAFPFRGSSLLSFPNWSRSSVRASMAT